MEYRTTYRHTHFALPALLAVLLLFGLGIYLALVRLPGEQVMTAVLWGAGATLLAVFLIFANCYRWHSWTITATGLAIRERPRVPLTGLPRRAEVPFAGIAAIVRLESGLDRYVDIETRRGQVYRMPQAMTAKAGGMIGSPDPDASLEDFLAAIRQAAEAAGVTLPEPAEGLGFWNRLPGLFCLLLMLVLALAFAGAALWALSEGEAPSGHRSGYALGIVLFLPFGAGWMLVKALRRRWRVLALRRS
jgi:hypothetical protein